MPYRGNPGDNLKAAVDMGVHRIVNDKLRALGRGGYATVQREYGIRRLLELTAAGEFTENEFADGLDRILAEAVSRYVEEIGRRQGWLFHALGQANETIDSLTLERFIREQQSDFVQLEVEFIASLLAPTDPKEVNE